MAKNLLRMWNSTTLFELAHFLPLYLGPRGEDVRCGDVWAQRGWKLHLDEGFYIIFGVGERGGVQAVVRVLSWNRTNYFAPANAFLILRRDCVTMGQHFFFFLPGNYSRGDCRFAVITLMPLLILCTMQYHYSMLMFPFRHNHGEMRAHGP